MDFKFSSAVKSSETKGNASEVGATHTITYNDGTVQTVKVVEISDARWTISWDVIDSNPAVSYSSASHTLRLRRVTTNKTTFVEAVSDYSLDSDANVIADSKLKKLDLFADLAKSFA
jgi:hypothetical protein